MAQRVDDNAIASANDAFGQSVGNERVGLYSVDDVRGFSPVDVGNTRIDGLYFAPVERLPNRLVRGNKVRVGITAQGYPFPAPTGIVDYDLSASGQTDQLTLSFERAQFGSLNANLDSQLPSPRICASILEARCAGRTDTKGAISNPISLQAD